MHTSLLFIGGQEPEAGFFNVWAHPTRGRHIGFRHTSREEAEKGAQRAKAQFRQMHYLYRIRVIPHVITGPGDYVTRDGRRATIYGLDPTNSRTVHVCGVTWDGRQHGGYRAALQYWARNGRVSPFKEATADIVGRWEG